MKNQNRRVFIAEVLGWTEVTYTGISYQGIPPKKGVRFCNWKRPAPPHTWEDQRQWYWIPDYFNDLNAVSEAEDYLIAISDGVALPDPWAKYCQLLTQRLGCLAIKAPAKDRATAFCDIIKSEARPTEPLKNTETDVTPIPFGELDGPEVDDRPVGDHAGYDDNISH